MLPKTFTFMLNLEPFPTWKSFKFEAKSNKKVQRMQSWFWNSSFFNFWLLLGRSWSDFGSQNEVKIQLQALPWKANSPQVWRLWLQKSLERLANRFRTDSGPILRASSSSGIGFCSRNVLKINQKLLERLVIEKLMKHQPLELAKSSKDQKFFHGFTYMAC